MTSIEALSTFVNGLNIYGKIGRINMEVPLKVNGISYRVIYYSRANLGLPFTPPGNPRLTFEGGPLDGETVINPEKDTRIGGYISILGDDPDIGGRFVATGDFSKGPIPFTLYEAVPHITLGQT